VDRGVTKRLSQGEQILAEGGPLVTVGGPTSQNSEKGKEMIANLWMSYVDVHTT